MYLTEYIRNLAPIRNLSRAPRGTSVMANPVMMAGIILLGFGISAAQSQTDKKKPVTKPAAKLVRAIVDTYGNWRVTCQEFAARPGKQQCSAALRILHNKTKRTLFTWIIFNDPKSKAVMSAIQTPTGIRLKPGVTLNFAKGTTRKFTFTSCEPRRCTALFPLGTALRREINRAVTAKAKGTAAIVTTTATRINFELIPTGFQQAYQAILPRR